MSPIALVPSARERLFRDLDEELKGLAADHLLRRLITLEAVHGPMVRIEGRELVSWCSNDYLGLSQHPALARAAAGAALEWGVGSRASRLLAGSTRWHARLEDALAAWFGAEAALVYPSGYLANLGTLGALLSADDAVFIDRLAHASLFDAARATRATFRVFHHHDVGHLAGLLSRATGHRRRLIITEGLFSMDGDCAPLADLLAVAESHEALVYLDDAHGAFVLGETGRGAPEAAGLPHGRFLYMGALGKALGCQGGFVVGPRVLIEFLRNRARMFVYTTALAVPVAAAAVAALQLLEDEPDRRQRLRARVHRLRSRLDPLGDGAGSAAADSPIFPIIVGEPQPALQLAQHLWDHGHWVPAVRPPSVPEGTARLRLSVTALHTEAQLDTLGDALQEGLRRLQKASR